jgi:NAD+ synthase (glutamine-hydrolysing)
VKVALAQINPVIGDFTGNCNKILKYSQKADERGCRLVIFPELAVSGYPPLDLLERKSFIQDHAKAVDTLLSKLPQIDVMFGCFESRQGGSGKPLYNSALVCRSGKIIHRTRKRLLPAYDVFDENRYFEPGTVPEIYELDGRKVAITVCEDIWHHSVGEYRVEPVSELFEYASRVNSGVDFLVNISASPYHRGKTKKRGDIFSSLCVEFNTPFLYVNQVGGQDSLLFDGHSRALDRSGRVTASAHRFKEDLIVVDVDNWHGDIRTYDESNEIRPIHDALVMGTRDYVYKSGFNAAVLGLSGGIDSALTAAIAVEALGAENVLGVALPSPYSSADSLEDARDLATRLGCRFETIPIGGLFDSYRETLEELFAGFEEDVTEQNIQARIRGNLLMALSNKLNHLLLATGNKSELAVGYCTLYGDMSGGLAVISDVPKQLVYELARFINRHDEIIPLRTITKAPTAELRPDQCDQDDLPPYDLLDQILELYLEEGYGRQQIIAQGYAEDIVDDVVRRIRINEYKRKQAPMGLKVTSKAFGFGRRLPNVQNYRG